MTSHARRLTSAVAVAVLVLLPALFAVRADASYVPSTSTRAAIVAAIEHVHGIGSPSLYRVRDIRVSSVGPYARASTVPRNPDVYQGQLVVLRKKAGVWKVIDFGTAGVGCTLPKAVQRDLAVTPPASFCAHR